MTGEYDGNSNKERFYINLFWSLLFLCKFDAWMVIMQKYTLWKILDNNCKPMCPSAVLQRIINLCSGKLVCEEKCCMGVRDDLCFTPPRAVLKRLSRTCPLSKSITSQIPVLLIWFTHKFRKILTGRLQFEWFQCIEMDILN